MSNQLDSYIASEMSELAEPQDEIPNYSYNEVYQEDIEHWRQDQIELNEREQDE